MAEEEFTDEERRALEAWKVGDPPDMTERVLAELEEKPRRPFWIGVATAIVLLAAVIGASMIRGGSSEASHLADRRMTVRIGDRAVAVMEAGARLSYRARGVIDVEQPAGNVFYRVDPGDAFVVRTPAGTVTVVGTCFRVEVRDMNSIVAGGVGAVAGALIAGTVLVTVYEGRVETVSEGRAETVALEAGERAVLVKGRAPEKRTSNPAAAEEPVAAEESIAALEAIDPVLLPERVRTLSREKAALERQVAELRAELEQAKRNRPDAATYDLPHEELVKMAERCELRWDNQGIGGRPQTLAPEDLEKLELSEEEAEIVNQRFAESQARLLEEVRKTYTQITGDDDTGSLAGPAMFAEIHDKTTEAELKRIYQTLARERAGLQPPPPEGAPMSPLERLYRIVTSEGDRLEQSIAQDLGPETARRIRDLRKGWGQRSRSSQGCP